MLTPGKKARREVHDLPLTAMIDVFSMIVIFLILGTVFGAADVEVPANMLLPESGSKEGVESAPRVTIGADGVRASFVDGVAPLEWFAPAAAEAPEFTAYKAKIKEFVASLPGQARSSGVLINVIADRGTPYKQVFDTVRAFREAGFESLLFVATGAGGGPQPDLGGGGAR